LNKTDIDYLLSSEGRRALDFGRTLQGSELARLEQLRARFSPARAAAVLKTLQLRRKAAHRFEKADEMLFTNDGLQQASSSLVAGYRARRFAGLGTIADLCCGIGGDTIELAKVCPKVIAVDADPETIRIAGHNIAVHGLAHKVTFRVADVSAGDFPEQILREADAVFIDPSRRATGRRVIALEDYSPPRDVVLSIVRAAGRAAVKCAPALDYERLQRQLSDPHETLAQPAVEVISLDGECKEVVLWFGEIGPEAAVSAVVLPQEARLEQSAVPPAAVKPPGKFIIEPDPAVIRAHLIDELADRFGLWKIDDSIAYLSGDCERHAPLFDSRPVLEWLPFNLKKLNIALRRRNVGRVDIKARGFPLAPAELKKKLKLGGRAHATLFCTRHAGRHIVILGGG